MAGAGRGTFGLWSFRSGRSPFCLPQKGDFQGGSRISTRGSDPVPCLGREPGGHESEAGAGSLLVVSPGVRLPRAVRSGVGLGAKRPAPWLSVRSERCGHPHYLATFPPAPNDPQPPAQAARSPWSLYGYRYHVGHT